jgi:hypothetical protein
MVMRAAIICAPAGDGRGSAPVFQAEDGVTASVDVGYVILVGVLVTTLEQKFIRDVR